MTGPSLRGGGPPALEDEQSPTWYWKLDFALLREAAAIHRRDSRGFPATPEHAFVYDRYRDSHEFWYVRTGYRTDRAGEAGIIAWTFAQTGNGSYPVFHMTDAPGAPDPTGSLE